MSGHEDFRLPPGWEEKSISQVTIKTKQRDPRRTPHQRFRYVDVSSISRELFKITSPTELLGADAPSRARKEIQENDVLFATVRPTLRRIAIVPADLNGEIASTGYCVLRSDLQQVDPRFLYFYLLTDHFNSRMAGLERGASYPAVSDSDVTNSRIPLPPLPEQKAISHSLSAVQRAIEAQERIIQTTTELKQALMQKLFSEGLRGEPQKMTEIGLVPESWEVVSFEEFATLQRGFDLRKQDFRPGTVPVVGATQVIGYHDTANVKGPGVTVVRSGSSAGLPQYIQSDFWAHNVLLYVKDFHGNIPRFVYHKIASLDLTRYRQGVAVPTLNRNTFRHIRVSVPSYEEQREIIGALDIVEQRGDASRRHRLHLQDLFSSLLHNLITTKS